MSQKKYLINTLEACEKFEFDKVVKSYLREVYGYNRIVVTDGNNDTGIDIKVFDHGPAKIQYQLTVQKSTTTSEKKKFETKLFEDVNKAAVNQKNYGYSNALFFFYSKTLTNKAIRDYTKTALSKGVSLTIIEANQIAEESIDYLVLQNEILSTTGISDLIQQNDILTDDQTLIFDLISFGESSNYKLKIVEAQLLEFLYNNPNQSEKSILDKCYDKFGDKDNSTFYSKLIGKLLTNHQVIKNKLEETYSLSTEEHQRVSKIKQTHNTEKQAFVKGLMDVLDKYNLITLLPQCIDLLKGIYINGFSSNLLDTIHNMSSDSVGGVSKSFLVLIQNRVQNIEKSRKIIYELLQSCKDDKFIQKYSASKVFTEKTSINRVENYISQKKKVYLDTQIVLYCLCYYANPNLTTNRYFYNVAKSLIDLSRQKDIIMYLPDRYLWEIRAHFQRALLLALGCSVC